MIKFGIYYNEVIGRPQQGTCSHRRPEDGQVEAFAPLTSQKCVLN